MMEISLPEFLAPFLKGLEGYTCLVWAERSEDPEENKTWSDFGNRFVPVLPTGLRRIPREFRSQQPPREFYFTPAVFNDEHRRRANFHGSNVLWVDFDEPTDWTQLDPAPSIVVQTSDVGKIHAYWVMDETITEVSQLEFLNRVLLTKFGQGADKSGFDAPQILRLPGGANLKLANRGEDGEFFRAVVRKFDPSLTYSVETFEGIAEELGDSVREMEVFTGSAPEAPEVDYDVLDSLVDTLPHTLKQRINMADPKGDRSSAIFRLVKDLHKEMSWNEEQIFQVLVDTPNDKFGPDRLWQDIYRILNDPAKSPENDTDEFDEEADDIAPLLKKKRDRVKYFRQGGVPKEEVNNEIIELVDKLFSKLGSFAYFPGAEEAYFVTSYDWTGKKTRDRVTYYSLSSGVSTLLNRWLHIRENLDRNLHKDCIKQLTENATEGNPVEMKIQSYYDASVNKVYVDRGGESGQMYVLDSEGNVEKHAHGYNSVYFDPSVQTPEPIEYRSNARRGEMERLLLNGPSYSASDISNFTDKHLHVLLRAWVVASLMPEFATVRPALVFYGEADSGKTTFFQGLSVLLTGDPLDYVVSLRKGPDFADQMCNFPHQFFDNVDIVDGNMQDTLSQAITGGSFKKRKLYTTRTMIKCQYRASVGMTTRFVEGLKMDLVSRLLMIKLQPFLSQDNFSARRSSEQIHAEIRDNRGRIFSEIFEDISCVLSAPTLEPDVNLQSEMAKFRFPRFLEIVRILCENHGVSFTTVLKYMVSTQSTLEERNEPIFLVAQWIADRMADKKLSPTDIIKMFPNMTNRDVPGVGKLKKAYSPDQAGATKLGHMLTKYVNSGSFRVHGIEVEIVKASSTAPKKYVFRRCSGTDQEG